MYQKIKSYTVIYSFNHSRMGFQNSITVKAFNYETALDEVKKQVCETYGNKMFFKFSFKPDPLNNGTII